MWKKYCLYLVREDVFCAFKGFYCLDLRLDVKDHTLHAPNIKITTYYCFIKFIYSIGTFILSRK
jgi:hypothetical protein